MVILRETSFVTANVNGHTVLRLGDWSNIWIPDFLFSYQCYIRFIDNEISIVPMAEEI